MESARIWLLADQHQDAIASIQTLLSSRGATVEVLDFSLAMEKIVRDRGGRILDNVRGLLAKVRGNASDEDEDAEDTEEALEDVLERGRPDLIVATSARYLSTLDLLTRMAGGQALRVALLPDYNLSNAWFKGAAHAYVVPHEGLQGPLLEAGIDGSRLFVGGPALPAVFSAKPDADKLREEFGLSEAPRPIIFSLCDGQDPAALDRLVFQFSLVDAAFTPIFYVGQDEQAAEALRRAARTHGIVANLLREVPNIQDFMAVADLIVTSPEDERIVGALALDKPLLLVGDPGPVTTQTDFLVGRGAAWHVADELRLGAEIELAMRPGRLEDMHAASAKVGRVTGTLEVADALALILEQRSSLQGPPPTLEGQEDGPQQVGPFERIGAATAQPVAPKPSSGPFEFVGGGRESEPSVPKPPSRPVQPAPVTPLSANEAKDELAALIMSERELERSLAQSRREQEQWHNRLELAREWNEGDLAKEAEAKLRRVLDDVERMNVELEKVRVQKEKLKTRVRKGRPNTAEPERSDVPDAPPAESRFRDMEVESDLSELRRRLREEMGD